MCASFQNGNVPQRSDGDEQHGPQPGFRLPWTSTPSEGTSGMGGITAEQSSVLAGPMPAPENMPGFPFYRPEEDLTIQAHQAHQAPTNQGSTLIRPLPGMSKTPQAVAQQAKPLQATQQAQQASGIQQLRPQQTQASPQNITSPLPRTTTQPHLSSTNPSNTGRLNLNMVAGDHLGTTDQLDLMFLEPRTIPETGLNQGLISDLVIKTMYFTSYLSGQELSAALRLPFYGVLDHAVNMLKKEQLCEVSGTSGLGEAGYQYILTVKGMERAHQVLNRSSYIGPAPVPLARYIEALKAQTSKKPTVTREMVENALKGMITSEELNNAVGAAVNAGKSLFLFGAPGNGKTLLTERIANMLGGSLAIPYSIEADGQIIQLFDLNSHRPDVPHGANESDSTRAELGDRRWVRIHRPVVMVGGELAMSSLDLVYNENAGFYEAPFQLKANGGLFLIDDFGRQQASPQALLNRWIVPLEKSIDFLTLKTGKKLQVPFELFLVLSTNLQPEELIDDAFLRRIQNKLNVPDPTPQQFCDIFIAQCRSMNVPFDQHGFTHLVNKHYLEVSRPFRASQPRDLLRQLIGIARYRNMPPELSPQLLDLACSTYFVSAKPKK
ncbi:MAG: hypothetical protein M3014_11735 [Chloroflexota bacterium]|nr:hypothetical protein [Chloroflexota bacterium]